MIRYTQLFGKTNKSSKEFDSKNATLLIKGGFIDQVMSGVYVFLPLGLRVLNKIERIVREEMDKIGQEVYMSALSPKEIWQTTGRLNIIDVLLQVTPANETSKQRHDAQYILNSTHEEMITPIAKQFNKSYKDFPFAVYQIQTKFRNEERPKSGLLRGREFRMKDLYSFHTSEQELKEYYEKAKEAYFTVFKRLGLGNDTYCVAASGGDFTKDFSHEFQTRCEQGEDTIFFSSSTKEAFNKEIAPSLAQTPKQDQEQKEMEEVYGEGIIGVDDLCRFLNIQSHQTSKTLVYRTNAETYIMASVRGDYEVNELKLAKVAQVDFVTLASLEEVKKMTGADIGYAGLVNVPNQVKVYIDDSLEHLVNFETGANKTNYHAVNVNWERDIPKPNTFYDIKLAKEGDMHPQTKEIYDVFQASEVGNIFPLNTKFSDSFEYAYTDAHGKQQKVYMGSYGIGTTRVMGVLVEKFHDEKGIIWPHQIAPFDIHFIVLDKMLEQESLECIKECEKYGFDVLFDDRYDIRPGEKFSDADLIGIPYRIVLSKKSKEQGGIEVKRRNESHAQIMSIQDFIQILKKSKS